MCVVLQHHLAKGGLNRRPPVGYPRYMALPGIEPECAPGNVWPLHRQSGPSCPDTLTNRPPVGCAPASSRLDCDRGAFGAPPSPSSRADFRVPLHPHDQGRRRSPLEPIGQPCRGWIATRHRRGFGGHAGAISALPAAPSSQERGPWRSAVSRTTTARAGALFGLADTVPRATRSLYVLVVLKKGAALRPVGRGHARPRGSRSGTRDPASCRRCLR